jgi:hypothetical protein
MREICTIVVFLSLTACGTVRVLPQPYRACGIDSDTWVLREAPDNAAMLLSIAKPQGARSGQVMRFFWFGSSSGDRLTLCRVERSTAEPLPSDACASRGWLFEFTGSSWRLAPDGGEYFHICL